MYMAERLGMSRDKAFIVEWQYGYAGGFTKALIGAMVVADDFNLEKISKGFPEEVNGYKKYRNEYNWWQNTVAEYEEIMNNMFENKKIDL